MYKGLYNLEVKKLTFEVVLKIDGTEVIPYVDYPIADNINWYSYRNIYPYNGTLYEVETVVAQPKAGYKSSLMLEGHAIIEQDTSTNWVAGAVEALKVVAFDGMGEAIPKASFVLTVYDSAKAFVAGISKVTVVTSASISYTYSHTTNVCFKYVKEASASDNTQSMTFVCSSGKTCVGYQYPKFEYVGGTTPQPNVIQGSRIIDSVPEKYNDNLTAVEAYVNMHTGAHSYASRVLITGPESKVAFNIYLPTPVHPWQIT
ncbi:MAG: hypothetical protein HFF58_03870 [Lawsonibacter sp.]|jgi:hypothetical protein|nr:hypothetical protein [Lawsonibacter sp.]